jgi:hypothetical protein
MRDETIVVKVLDSQTRLAKAGPAGQVVDGTVTLAGMLLKWTLKNAGLGNWVWRGHWYRWWSSGKSLLPQYEIEKCEKKALGDDCRLLLCISGGLFAADYFANPGLYCPLSRLDEGISHFSNIIRFMILMQACNRQ